jgi:hypothetical protein
MDEDCIWSQSPQKELVLEKNKLKNDTVWHLISLKFTNQQNTDSILDCKILSTCPATHIILTCVPQNYEDWQNDMPTPGCSLLYKSPAAEV